MGTGNLRLFSNCIVVQTNRPLLLKLNRFVTLTSLQIRGQKGRYTQLLQGFDVYWVWKAKHVAYRVHHQHQWTKRSEKKNTGIGRRSKIWTVKIINFKQAVIFRFFIRTHKLFRVKKRNAVPVERVSGPRSVRVLHLSSAPGFHSGKDRTERKRPIFCLENGSTEKCF